MIARKLSLFGTPNTSAIVRLMGLAWRYRARVIGLLVLQFILMGLSILALQLSGFAIDWIIYRKSGAQSPPLIYKWHPMFRDHVWQEILVIAAIIAMNRFGVQNASVEDLLLGLARDCLVGGLTSFGIFQATNTPVNK